MERSMKASGVSDRKINKNNKNNKYKTSDIELDNKPIYAWELKNLEKVERSTISNEYGTFLPSLKAGIYTSVGDTTEVHARHVDFQVVLTEDEMMTIISRQKALRQEALHRQRFTERRKENRLGLMASSPYIDKRRVHREIYRHDNPEKWTDRRGFRPVGPAVKSINAHGSVIQ